MKFLKDKEIWDTFFVSGGIVLGSFFSYLLQFALGRILSVEDYGAFNALLSFSVLLGIPAILFGAPLIKVVSELHANEKHDVLAKMFVTIILFSLGLGALTALGVFLFKNVISENLQIYNSTAIWVFGVGLMFTYATPIAVSYLQGVMRYKLYVLLTVLSSFLRFLLMTVFAFKGYGLTGIFVGSVISTLLSIGVGVYLLREFVSFDNSENLTQYFKKILKLGYFTIILYAGLSSLNNIDVVLVKSLFDPVMAGYYSATVTVGKILLFGAGSVTIVMFPRVSALFAKGGDYRSIFKKMFVIQLLIVGFGVGVYAVLSKLIVNFLFGSKFDHAIEYLPIFSVFVGMYVIVNFLLMYLLAIERMYGMYILIPVVALQYALINFYHENLYQVIYSNIAVCSVALLLLLLHSIRITNGRKSGEVNIDLEY